MNRLSSHPRKSLPRKTRGSVLLIVVVLLLLMAIMGTAYLTTTRVERLNSYQATVNSQIEAAMESAREMAVSKIVGNLFSTKTGIFRPAGDPVAADVTPNLPVTGDPAFNDPAYNRYDGPDYLGNMLQGDTWLASRIPDSGPTWPTISASLGADGLFESPDGQGTYSNYTKLTLGSVANPNAPPANYPAFTISGKTYIAADADGSGMSNGGLIRTGITVDGVTYYIGFRIIDNNSAVNVNTAYDARQDYDFNTSSGNPNGTPYPSSSVGYFTGNVGLYQVLDSNVPANASADMAALNNVRFGGAVPAQTPVDDNKAIRSDFSFGSQFDALYHMLGRRPINPGYVNTGGTQYRAMGDADQAALSYHFFLINPSTYANPQLIPLKPPQNLLPMTLVEQLLVNSAFKNAPNYDVNNPWRSRDPSATALFYSDVTNGSNARPYLVTRNGVSNACPAYSADPNILSVPNAEMVPYGDRGRWQANVSYNVGDVVTYAYSPTRANGADNVVSSGVYVCLKNNTGILNTNSPLDTTNTFWARATQWVQGVTPTNFVCYNNRFYTLTGSSSGTPGGASGDWALWNPPASAMGLKADVNTALFPELYRAYWNVFAVNTGISLAQPYGTITTPFGTPAASLDPSTIYLGNQFAAASPYTPVATANPFCMLRSSVRDNTTPLKVGSGMIFSPIEMMKLRAAIAAVNAENLRSPDAWPSTGTGGRTVIAREITLNLNIDGTDIPVNVDIYGNEPQPFITEVFAQSDIKTVPPGASGPNPSGYVAIKLFNPYPFPIPLVSSAAGNSFWRIATVDRSARFKTIVPIAALDITTYPLTGGNLGVPIVPANGYLLLENYNPNGGGTAVYRPGSSGLPQTGKIDQTNLPSSGPNRQDPSKNPIPFLNTLYIPNLGNAIGKEVVLLHRRNPTGASSINSDGNYKWDDSSSTSCYDFVPADSFDLSGMLESATVAQAIHYSRSNDRSFNPAISPQNWKFVYPGRYDGSQAFGRQQGTDSVTWNPSNGETDKWDKNFGNPVGVTPTPAPALGTTANANTATTTTTVATYPTTFNIQLTNANWAGPSKPAANNNVFPFGGFARSGDILEAPYIASYIVYDPKIGRTDKGIYELNSVTMDAAFADDTDTSDDSVEQVGRFCPLIPYLPGDSQRTGPNMRYGWARSLFDYLTVQNPRDDYLPNTDPSRYPPSFAFPVTPPAAIANSDPTAVTTPIANTDAENGQGVQGLVNINTAPYEVLAALPLVIATDGSLDVTNTKLLAQAIINDREANGPFTSLFDLNRVGAANPTTSFITGAGQLAGYSGAGFNFTGKTTGTQGNLSNINGPDGITNQFTEMYVQIARLSNLVTTRSDTFTVYAVVEGWQNAGSANAQLVVARRSMFFVDRTGVTPTNRTPRVVTFPNN